MSWPRGSEWRKWDLHVHSPASKNFRGDWDQFIVQLARADCDVIGINDYFSIAGYREIRKRIANPETSSVTEEYQDALQQLNAKTFLPIVECRMSNYLVDRKLQSGIRLNFHIIFSPTLNIDDIERFIKNLNVKGKSIGLRYEDKDFLFDRASIDFSETCKILRNDLTFDNRFLIWIPYDEHGGLDKINPVTDKLVKEGFVRDADILGSSNQDQANFFLWKDDKFTEEQYSEWFDRRKPCIKGSDSHSTRDDIGVLKDRHSKPTDKYCWIKSDPTFEGLRQIIYEPENRVYIGKMPPKMEEVRRNPTRYIAEIRIQRTTNAQIDEIWFDCTIPLNPDMVAIIGNKGTGKSALSDILALVTNAHCDPEDFSFLTRERFCESNGRLARQFEAQCHWKDQTSVITSLNDQPDFNRVERAKYIPQSYLERVCTEIESGPNNRFQLELRKVIFSHLRDAERLGKGSLDELIDFKTAELNDQIESHRQEISRINEAIVKLERIATEDSIGRLTANLQAKRQELTAHEKTKPDPVADPSNLTTGRGSDYEGIGRQVETERSELARLNTEIASQQKLQRVLAKQIQVATKIESRLLNFQSGFDRLRRESMEDFKSLDLDFDEIVPLKINITPLKERQKELTDKMAQVDEALSMGTDTSLIDARTSCEQRIKKLQENLDLPNKRYQAYREQLQQWKDLKRSIEGGPDEDDTLRYYEAQLKFINEQLPKRVSTLRENRCQSCRKLHDTIVAIRTVYEELFEPVQALIQDDAIIKDRFGLTFSSSIEEHGFRLSFLKTYIDQRAAGSFSGKDNAVNVVDEILEQFDFDSADDTVEFIQRVIDHLQRDMRTKHRPIMKIFDQLLSSTDVGSLYDYLWSLAYLQPEYSLKFDGRDLSILSPGERGTLLLVFYLLLDRSSKPLIIDQPEENIDSETVYRLLIPVIKKVKERRQIIMVTHSPNIAVVCDAEQIIHASIDRKNRNCVAYTAGSIESTQINKYAINVLEGTRPAFDNRGAKYYSE